MHPYFSIFGKTVPAYGLMGAAGFVCAAIFVSLRSHRYGLSRDDSFYLLTLSSVGCIIGSKMLYLITVLPSLLHDMPLLIRSPQIFIAKYISGGMIFYGGLLGAILAARLTARFLDLKLTDFYPVLIPALVLFAAFGRVGCFLTGCCYGKETTGPLGVVFTHSLFTPHDCALLPVQLFEAGFDILLFVLLICLSRYRSVRPHLLKIYLFLYAIWRFIIEFFRGDEQRGIYGPFSTSQWISIIILIAVTVTTLCQRFQMRRDRST